MSEKEKRIIESVAEALPNMSDFDKGYILGVAESHKAIEKAHVKESAGAELEQRGA